MRYLKLLVMAMLVTIGVVKSNDNKTNEPLNINNVKLGGPVGHQPCVGN